MLHLNTKTYEKSLQLVSLSRQLVERLPFGFGFLTDQLKRASFSVVLNFSEGCSRKTKKERLRYFQIARGSVFEIAAIFDVTRHWLIIDEEIYKQGKDLCDHLSALLYRFQ